MVIYTTCFAKVSRLPDNVTPIAICIEPPSNWLGKHIPELAPTRQMIRIYTATGDFVRFAKEYREQILESQGPKVILDKITECCQGNTAVLVAYIHNFSRCYRSVLADWLLPYGISIVEYPLI